MTGTANSVEAVPASTPPSTAIASGYASSCPGLDPKAMNVSEISRVATAVIATGTSRSPEPSSTNA